VVFSDISKNDGTTGAFQIVVFSGLLLKLIMTNKKNIPLPPFSSLCKETDYLFTSRNVLPF